MATTNRSIDTRRLVTAGLLVGVGVLLPYLTGHAFGVPGTVLLPMHLPVLLSGFFCGPRYGALCGVIVPVLSCLTTGMPVAFPMLPIMACELFLYGLVSGLCHHRFKWPVFAALPTAMVAGRIAYGLVFALLTLTSSGPLKALSVGAAISTGLPGIVIQLVLVPILVNTLEKTTRKPAASLWDERMLEAQIPRIKAGEHSCIVVKDGAVLYAESGRGVSPLLRLYNSDPDTLKGAMVVDKIIGKAAAMILVCGGATAAYGEVMSQAARDYLADKGIAYRYGRCVGMIKNRTETGICPIEQSVYDIDDPHQGLEAIRKTIEQLMASAG